MITASKATPLPSWALEIIADGIQDDDNDDRRGLFRASHRVACSAVAHGWTEIEFRNLLKDGVKTKEGRPSNGLWRQVNTRRGRKLKWRTVDRFLSKVWQCAEDNIASGSDPERESYILTIVKRWSEVIANSAIHLSRSEALVLDYVITGTHRRKFRNIACPGRGVAEYTGLSHQGAVEALTSLRDRRIIIRRSSGTWVGNGRRGRAAIYSLADPDEFFSLLGVSTLPSENPSGQSIFNPHKRVTVHTNPLLGEGMYTNRPTNQDDKGRGTSHKSSHAGDETVGAVE